MEIKSTRLRFIIVKDELSASSFIDSLPFKVEMKGITQPVKGKGVVCWFVIPEHPGITFNSQDMR